MLPELSRGRGWVGVGGGGRGGEHSREPWAESAFSCHLQMITKKLPERWLSGPAILLVPMMLLLLILLKPFDLHMLATVSS